MELPPAPNAEEQAAIIEEVREYALNYSKSLPNFLSTQVVRRYQANAPGSRYNTHSSEPSWVQVDLLTLRLSYFDQKEEYKLIMHNNSPTTQDYKTIGGATSTGEFGSMLRDIFEPRTHARFWWDGWARLGAGRPSTGDGLRLQRGAGQFPMGHRVREEGSHRSGIQRAHPDRQGYATW